MSLYVAQNSFSKLKESENKTKAMLNAWIGKDIPNNTIISPEKKVDQPAGNYMWLFSGLK
jgi:hypothetical protein